MEPQRYTHYSTDPSEPLFVRYGEHFPANLPAKTVMDTLNDIVIRFPKKVSHRFKENGEVREVTWMKYSSDVIDFARACVAVGAHPHAGVAIQGKNSYLWLVANVGAIFARCVSTGVYPTNSAEDSRYVANLAKSEVVVVENKEQLQKYFYEGCPMAAFAKCFVVFEQISDEWKGSDIPVYSYEQFIAKGETISRNVVENRLSGVVPGECCTIIPTSGTTGRPKGVMLSHDNITFMTGTAVRIYDITENDRFLSYLPLSHIAAQLLDMYAPMATGASVTIGKPEELKEVRPTIFFGVPRVYEKIQEKMVEKGQQASTTKKKIVQFAKRKALENAKCQEKGENPPPLYGLTKKLILEKIPPLLGLDECRITATGAAPIREKTVEFWRSIEFSLLNVYGMSESTGIIACNVPGSNRFGTAGRELAGTELLVLPEDEHGKCEIATRGRHVFMGYIGNEEATKEAFTANGFLKTGDYGEIDNLGFLKVTGRKKELLITAGGENVAPIPIEDRIKEIFPWISNAMVVGDQRKYLTAVVTLKTVLDEEMQPTKHLAPETILGLNTLGMRAETIQEAMDNGLSEYLNTSGVIAAINLKAVSNAQKVQKIAILPEDFNFADKTLTPTMKLRRPVVLEKYADSIEKMYV